MKCYIWWEEWRYIISRSKQVWFSERECTDEQLSNFAKIKHWAIEEIQERIKEILYANQLELWLQKEK